MSNRASQPIRHLVLGGARSGKSAFTEQCALAAGKRCVYIATAEAGDDEMAARISHHRARRDERWLLCEEPLGLGAVLSEYDSADNVLLLDCLTLWLSNCLHHKCLAAEKGRFLEVLAQLRADVILVCNEVGSGVVPLGELSREFVDQSGWLQQDVAGLCSHVTQVIAGLPLVLKEPERQ